MELIIIGYLPQKSKHKIGLEICTKTLCNCIVALLLVLNLIGLIPLCIDNLTRERERERVELKCVNMFGQHSPNELSVNRPSNRISFS